MRLLLDTGMLSQVCYPFPLENRPFCEWFLSALGEPDKYELVIPEIADYELRRKLIHLKVYRGHRAAAESLVRLDELVDQVDYQPIDSETMHQAANFWAEARGTGRPTAPEPALDGDVILAAQAFTSDGQVLTNNPKHLGRFVQIFDWQSQLPAQ